MKNYDWPKEILQKKFFPADFISLLIVWQHFDSIFSKYLPINCY